MPTSDFLELERPACFETVPTARAVRRCRQSARAPPVVILRSRQGRRQGAWRLRAVHGLNHGWARSDLLFTMSDNMRSTSESRPGAKVHIHGRRVERAVASQTGRGATPSAPIRRRRSGGARRDRTDDLLLAKQALSQLSYGPFRESDIRGQ
jgi:hypothetical protein